MNVCGISCILNYRYIYIYMCINTGLWLDVQPEWPLLYSTVWAPARQQLQGPGPSTLPGRLRTLQPSHQLLHPAWRSGNTQAATPASWNSTLTETGREKDRHRETYQQRDRRTDRVIGQPVAMVFVYILWFFYSVFQKVTSTAGSFGYLLPWR